MSVLSVPRCTMEDRDREQEARTRLGSYVSRPKCNRPMTPIKGPKTWEPGSMVWGCPVHDGDLISRSVANGRALGGPL